MTSSNQPQQPAFTPSRMIRTRPSAGSSRRGANAFSKGRRTLTVSLMALALAGCVASGAQDVGYEQRLMVAEKFAQNGQYDKAFQIFDEVGDRYQSSAEVQLALGDAYLRSSASVKAMRSFKRARANGAAREASVGLGRLALFQNDLESAKANFQAVLVNDPDNLVALNGLGVAHDISGDHDAARRYYTRVLDIDPADENSLNNFGLSLVLSGETEDGAQMLDSLVRSRLDNVVARLNLAIAYHMQGRQSDANRLAQADLSAPEAAALFAAIGRYAGAS